MLRIFTTMYYNVPYILYGRHLYILHDRARVYEIRPGLIRFDNAAGIIAALRQTHCSQIQD